MKNKNIVVAFALLGIVAGMAFADVDLPTKFTNRNSVLYTRHNLTQRQPGNNRPYGILMDTYRNNYGEVCVYCHTPHGANTKVNLPLWNRTMKTTNFTTYNQLGTSSLTQEIGQPGTASLACLSCHDGQTAIDSIINMPGSGRYLANQETSVSDSFLSAWTNPLQGQWDQPGASGQTYAHANLTECLACHSPGTMVGAGAANFSIAVIGTDLRDDHPVGINFPTKNGEGTDFNTPTGTRGEMRYFDTNGNGSLDKQDVRLYATNGKARVECASCHDPHGVPSAGAGSEFNPTFLRVANTASALCLTCHSK